MQNKDEYSELNDIVASAIRGDKHSFNLLCEVESSKILLSCIRMMGNVPDGEDAAQEVLIVMHNRIKTLNAPCAFVCWLQKIIFNICTKMRRNNMKHIDALPMDDFADMFSEEDTNFLPEKYFEQQEKREELLEIIDGLSDKTRDCITMFYFSELKISEVAEVMNISENSVKAHLYIGREKIRKIILKKGEVSYLNVSSGAGYAT